MTTSTKGRLATQSKKEVIQLFHILCENNDQGAEYYLPPAMRAASVLNGLANAVVDVIRDRDDGTMKTTLTKEFLGRVMLHAQKFDHKTWAKKDRKVEQR